MNQSPFAVPLDASSVARARRPAVVPPSAAIVLSLTNGPLTPKPVAIASSLPAFDLRPQKCVGVVVTGVGALLVNFVQGGVVGTRALFATAFDVTGPGRDWRHPPGHAPNCVIPPAHRRRHHRLPAQNQTTVAGQSGRTSRGQAQEKVIMEGSSDAY